MDKRGSIIIILLSVAILLLGVIIVLFYKFYIIGVPNEYKNNINNENPLENRNQVIQKKENPPNIINQQDFYVLPDFEELKSSLMQESILYDLPKSGSVKLGFYHFSGEDRIWDKIYYLTKGRVEEKDDNADIDIWMHTDYVDELSVDFCQTVKLARNNGDIGQSVNIETTKLLWRYSGMTKYKGCLLGSDEGLNNSPVDPRALILVLVILILIEVVMIIALIKLIIREIKVKRKLRKIRGKKYKPKRKK